MAIATPAVIAGGASSPLFRRLPLPCSSNLKALFPYKTDSFPRHSTKLAASSSPRTISPKSPSSPADSEEEERVFFDGGAHYGDLLANLAFGFTLLWLPLTFAAISRAFFLRYRFTNRRVTVVSGFTGQDRSDFPYSAIQDVQLVPRFIGEWGDLVITLRDGTKVDLRSVPKFREIADYCLYLSKGSEEKTGGGPRGF